MVVNSGLPERWGLTLAQFIASMWSLDEARRIVEIAKKVRHGVAIHAIPHGLQIEQGPDVIVKHLLRNVPHILDSVEL